MSNPAIDLNQIALLGVDVGFSKTRPTTGIAWSNAGKFDAARTHSDWERRRLHLPPSTSFSVIAIDGPLVPDGSPDLLIRTCEQLLARGTFQKRCKPGSSHFGTGLELKRAANETAKQIGHLTTAPAFANAVFRDVAIVEAFPNAFLGVLLSDEIFATDKIKRGKKFDWMYEHAVKAGKFGELLAFIDWNASDLLKQIEAERDHEKRAAYLCLLTAACAAADKAEIVGDESTGWIWLPPAELWASWARDALEKNRLALV